MDDIIFHHSRTLRKSGCGQIGHYNKSSFLCPLNKTNIENVRRIEEGNELGKKRQPAVRQSEGKESRKLSKIDSFKRKTIENSAKGKKEIHKNSKSTIPIINNPP